MMSATPSCTIPTRPWLLLVLHVVLLCLVAVPATHVLAKFFAECAMAPRHLQWVVAVIADCLHTTDLYAAGAEQVPLPAEEVLSELEEWYRGDITGSGADSEEVLDVLEGALGG
jgi:hypothetical protein